MLTLVYIINLFLYITAKDILLSHMITFLNDKVCDNGYTCYVIIFLESFC